MVTKKKKEDVKKNLKINIPNAKVVKGKPKTDAKKNKKIDTKKYPSMKLKLESDIAMDFATKAYQKFNKMIKSVVLFGSTIKGDATAGSDIDIILILDDVTIKWDQELIAWYRTELNDIMMKSPYRRDLHINTIKLSTWWQDLMIGDPVVINIIRYGEAIIDLAGFFEPLKFLLIQGKIKSTPEAIHNALQRAPIHIAKSRAAELGAIEGVFWSMVDSAHAALIAANVLPPSPEHIPLELKEHFVNSGKIKMKYVVWFRDIHVLHKKITHGKINNLTGVEIDEWQNRAEEFLKVMVDLINKLLV
jgi:predicted nucleotidyltransferase/uncharacterized protein (UPF0332 family)